MNTLEYQCSVKTNELLITYSPKLLLTSGPCTVSPRVLRAFEEPLAYYNDKRSVKAMVNTRWMLRYIFQTQNEATFPHQAPIEAGIDAMVTSLTEPGDRIVIAISGAYGQRLHTISSRYGLNIVKLESKPGLVFEFEELEQAIATYKPTVLFIVHAEPETGIVQPLDGLGDICHRHDCLLAVDASATLGAIPLFVDRWKLDAVVSGSEGAIGCVASFALTTYSNLAMKKITANTRTVRSFYIDVVSMTRFYDAMEFQKELFFVYTKNYNMIAAIHEALASICEEGLEHVWYRHKLSGETLRKGILEMGLKSSYQNKNNRLHAGIGIFHLPSDIPSLALNEYLRMRYKVELPNLTNSDGNLRFAVVGYNARLSVVEYILQALKESIEYIRKRSSDS